MNELEMHTQAKSPEQVDAVLKPPMQALRQSMGQLQTPARVEQELLACFAQKHQPLPWYKRIADAYWQFASAAAVAVLVMSVSIQTGRLGHDAWAPASDTGTVDSLVREDIPFIALGSGEAIALQENMRIVQAEVPHAMLASMGISVSADQIGGSSTAEMLFGANDQPLAVRFVPASLK
ncbi:hypothetical protein H8K35_03670 [Undibacterium sp. LX40W]|uniref:Uncharacterized protein n=1 Tax=Undibacterium nitidum TaxID=2762298 RepID=A0A923HLE5_9BURK|nr:MULTISPECIES: hypothetical protein [Undibacterium]MBC3880513.1 hypothetical protein [Undibacterium nitidum]MBC3890751.1 hypothetical protein [Undibacterium sp. LX40W]